MGLWSKAKGVFGRIGSGIRQGWNWLTRHKDDIEKIADAAQQFVPSQYQDQYKHAVDTGKDYFSKTDDGLRKFGII